MPEITLAHKAAEAHCGYHRYLRYHVGGTGIVPVSSGPKIVTDDDAIRNGVAAMTSILRAHDRLPTTPEMREIVSQGQQGYDEEQAALLSGLLWSARLTFLPWFHERFRVIAISEPWQHTLTENTTLIGTTDLVAQLRKGQGLNVFHVEPVGHMTGAKGKQWTLAPWLALSHPEAVHYVLALVKGDRVDGKQQTPLCYGYCRSAEATDDWLPAYEWQDADGTKHRVPKGFDRRGIWAVRDSDWTTWRAYQGQDPEMPGEEFWVRHLPTSVLERTSTLVGPLTYHPATVQALKMGWARGECFWNAMTHLDIPRSWHCLNCDYVPVCHHQIDGDPLESGQFVPRQEP